MQNLDWLQEALGDYEDDYVRPDPALSTPVLDFKTFGHRLIPYRAARTAHHRLPWSNRTVHAHPHPAPPRQTPHHQPQHQPRRVLPPRVAVHGRHGKVLFRCLVGHELHDRTRSPVRQRHEQDGPRPERGQAEKGGRPVSFPLSQRAPASCFFPAMVGSRDARNALAGSWTRTLNCCGPRPLPS